MRTGAENGARFILLRPFLYPFLTELLVQAALANFVAHHSRANAHQFHYETMRRYCTGLEHNLVLAHLSHVHPLAKLLIPGLFLAR